MFKSRKEKLIFSCIIYFVVSAGWIQYGFLSFGLLNVGLASVLLFVIALTDKDDL